MMKNVFETLAACMIARTGCKGLTNSIFRTEEARIVFEDWENNIEEEDGFASYTEAEKCESLAGHLRYRFDDNEDEAGAMLKTL